MDDFITYSATLPDSRITAIAASLLSCDSPLTADGLIKEKTSKKRSRIVYQFEIDGEQVFFKMYCNYQLLKSLQDRFRGSRARRAYFASLSLKKKGFNLATPVAAFENKALNPLQRSIFVTRDLKGHDFIEHFLEDASPAQQEQYLGKLLGLYKQLIDKHVYHRDLNLTNCRLIDNKLYLLDVDDVRELHFFHPIRLFYNIELHSRALVLFIARYPETWMTDAMRKSIISQLSSCYVPRFLLQWFIQKTTTASFKNSRQYLETAEQRDRLDQIIQQAN